MFKVGERVRLTDKCQYFGARYGYKVGDIGYITDSRHQKSLVVKMENPKSFYTHLWCDASELEDAEKTPPQKITHNGYEYSLVGPVKPEWLVDGAWVVGKETDELWQIIEGEKDNFVLRDRLGNLHIKEISTIVDYYRPHEPKDWKWGDWAMYYGNRVFVMSRMNHDCLVGISFPNIDGEDLTDPMRQWDFAEEHELTPTF